MLPDRVSNPGPLTYESGALPIALRGPAKQVSQNVNCVYSFIPAPFLLALSSQLSTAIGAARKTAERGLPLDDFGVKTEEIEQVCVFFVDMLFSYVFSLLYYDSPCPKLVLFWLKLSKFFCCQRYKHLLLTYS